tara:strand:+ start:145 stop:1092 length:948 start_codon:yes stop_codon:yes gene_type:complete
MKVLFLVDQAPDCSVDMVYYGMITLLGEDSVDHIPDKPHYYGDDTHLGKTAENILFPFKKKGLTAHPNYKDYDLIIAHHVVEGTWVKAVSAHNKVVVVDGCDGAGIDPSMYEACSLYFKRECYQATLNEYSKCISLPFAFIKNMEYKSTLKDIDVSFIATHGQYPSSDLRFKVFRMLSNLKQKSNLNGFNVVTELTERPNYNYSWKEYMDILYRSRISISMIGGGQDTYRYWEIPVTHTAMIAFKPAIIIENNFEHEKDVLFVSDMDEFKQALNRLLYDKNLSEALAINAYNHLTYFHLSQHRAQKILDEVARVS